MVELVDTLDSKSSASRRAGSIPALSTNKSKSKLKHKACFFVFVGFWFSKRRFGEKQPKGINPILITNYPKNNFFIFEYQVKKKYPQKQ